MNKKIFLLLIFGIVLIGFMSTISATNSTDDDNPIDMVQSASNTAKHGLRFFSRYDQVLTTALVHIHSTATKMYLLDASKAQLAVADIVDDGIQNISSFNYSINADTTYYLVTDAEGGAHTWRYKDISGGPFFNYTGINILWTGGYNNGADDPGDIFEITRITTDRDFGAGGAIGFSNPANNSIYLSSTPILINCSTTLATANMTMQINGNITTYLATTNITFFDVFPYGSYNLTCNATSGGTELTTGAYNMTTFNYIENTVSYNISTIATKTEGFLLNISFNPSIWYDGVATLYYNGTAYNATRGLYSDSLIFSNSLIMPSVSVSTNYTFLWRVGLINASGTFYFNSTTYEQEVNPIPSINVTTSAVCPTGFSKSIFFEIFNEQNLTIMNASINYNFQYGLGNNTASHYYGSLDSTHNFTVCINNSLSSYYIGYGEIGYTTDDYTTRKFYIFENTRITNQTLNNSLYLLENTLATSFLFSFQDQNLFPYSEKYASLLRWYPNLNEYKIVEMGKTDDKGETIMRVKSEDIDYRVGLYHANGSLIKLLNPVRFACVTSPCTYSTVVREDAISYTDFFNVETSLTFNETSNIFTFVWNDPSQNTQSMRLLVTRERGDGSVTICDTSASGFTGVLTCDTTGYTGTLVALAFRTASPETPIAQKIVSAGTKVLSSTVGLFISLILFLIFIFIGIWSPVASIILGMIGLIPAVVFGSITLPIFIGIGVLAGIIIHFMKRTG